MTHTAAMASSDQVSLFSVSTVTTVVSAAGYESSAVNGQNGTQTPTSSSSSVNGSNSTIATTSSTTTNQSTMPEDICKSGYMRKLKVSVALCHLNIDIAN